MMWDKLKMKKKLFKLMMNLGLALIFVLLVFRGLNYKDMANEFKSVVPSMVAAAVVMFFAGYAFRIERWRIMLVRENPEITWIKCAGPFMASVAVNNVLPFRAGDFLRAFGFNPSLGVSKTTSLTVIMVERMLDILTILFFFGISLAYFGLDSSQLLFSSGGLLLIISIIILLILFIPNNFKPFIIFLCQRISIYFPNLEERLSSEFEKVFVALDYTSKGVIIFRLIIWSIIIWIAEGMVFWFSALAIPSLVNKLAAFLALPVGTLATVIPSTPGYVGTFDYFIIQSMIFLGNSPSSSATFALLVHLLLWLPATIIGGAGYWYLHLTNRV